ncbi:cysteine hydrolase family protein [Marinibacterium sp. SX1]|uniref:cysteine hydrolase family protein n=1 Tax=Marinibacterium sp. SX1 TaxID=3388424 RepID=UPI003D182E43
MATAPWLFLIDLQPAFSSADSPWFTPGTDALYARLRPLVAAFGPRVLFSRFVPPEGPPEGSWAPYYAEWPFALTAPASMWALDDDWAGGRSIAADTFGKWTPEARAILDGAGEIVIGGVATECCVMNTVLAALDDARQVCLLTDGCAGSTADAHDAAVALMAMRAPQIRLSTIDKALAPT